MTPLLSPECVARLRRLGSPDKPRQIAEGSADERACRTLESLGLAETYTTPCPRDPGRYVLEWWRISAAGRLMLDALDTEPAPADDDALEGSILDHERSAEYDAEPGAEE